MRLKSNFASFLRVHKCTKPFVSTINMNSVCHIRFKDVNEQTRWNMQHVMQHCSNQTEWTTNYFPFFSNPQPPSLSRSNTFTWGWVRFHLTLGCSPVSVLIGLVVSGGWWAQKLRGTERLHQGLNKLVRHECFFYNYKIHLFILSMIKK